VSETTGTLDRGDGVRLAYARLAGAAPGVVFLGGFRSDMGGTKALFLRDWCAARGRAFLRLDYSGHGASGGAFEDGTIGRWTEDAALLIDRLTEGPQLLVGSSMGGWIALLLARRMPGRIAALLGIAAAPDFTERLMLATMSADQRATLARDGVVLIPSDYGEPYPITRALIEEGRAHLLLDSPIPFQGKVRLLQGMADPDVPWRHALAIAERLTTADVVLTLIKDGDHRLSRPQDLALLGTTLGALLGEDRA